MLKAAKRLITFLYHTLKFSFTKGWLNLKGVKYGKRPLFMLNIPLIRNYGEMIVGNNFRISCYQFKSELYTSKNGKLKIGNNVFINRGVSISANLVIEIGDNCLIGDMVSIQDSNWHEVTQNAGVKTSAIKIGKNVWIGKNTIILPGVTIGDHAVIGTSSIISKNIPAKSLVYQERTTIIKNFICDDDYTRR